MIGDSVGGYRIVSRIAEGATGEVWLGEHASVGTRAAIKVLRADLSADRERVQRYLREAQSASRVGHVGTVKITHVGQPPEGRAFLVMELLQGESLARRLARSRRLSITQIAELGRQIATILAAMHDDQLVHGDLRADKIFLVRDAGRESGLAEPERIKVLVGDATLLGPGHPRSAAYAAPEVWRDPASVDWRVDAYALGCLAFEMACGKPPYARPSSEDVRAQHLDQPVPTARSQMPDVPPALDALLAKLLAKRPDDRYPDADALRADLRRFTDGRKVEAAPAAAIAAPA
ncbi:MAG: serine/threonine protein kinase, partial [Deltaproteobacteria bacterium]|nr:serine/threonine protein kinase [Deltaproteobacteria bacterium]